MSAVYTPFLRMDTEIHFDDMLYSQINTSFFFQILIRTLIMQAKCDKVRIFLPQEYN